MFKAMAAQLLLVGQLGVQLRVLLQPYCKDPSFNQGTMRFVAQPTVYRSWYLPRHVRKHCAIVVAARRVLSLGSCRCTRSMRESRCPSLPFDY
jgi:hypothetical protein